MNRHNTICIAVGLCCSLLLPFAFGDDEKKSSRTVGQDKILAEVKKLGAESYQAREDAFEVLKKIGEEARPALKEALNSEDPEIRWRASKLLSYLDSRNVDRPEESGQRGKGKRLFPFRRDSSGIDRLSPKLDDDLDERSWPGWPGFDDGFLGRFRFFEDLNPFKEMDRLMDEMRRLEGGLKIEIDGSTAAYNVQRRDENGSVEMSLDIDEDGKVHARVTRTDKAGKKSEETYESDSLEGFKKANPDLAKSFGLDGFKSGFRSLDLDRNWPSFDVPGLKKLPGPPVLEKYGRRKTLGVYLSPDGLSRAFREHLGLKEGEGVLVDRVASETYAEEIGVESSDVIVAIKGKKISSADDIREALMDVEYGEKVPVHVIRDGKRKELAGKYTDLKSMKF